MNDITLNVPVSFRTLIARNFPLKLTKIFNLAKVFNYFKTLQGRTKQTETKSNGQNVITGKLSLCKWEYIFFLTAVLTSCNFITLYTSNKILHKNIVFFNIVLLPFWGNLVT